MEPGTLSRFLKDPLFHAQISAVRALSASVSKERNATLMAFITDDSRAMLARVFAALMLREAGARELRDDVIAYIPKAPTTRAGLGIDIMDPRIGTPFPESVKLALEAVVAEWK